MYKNWLKKKQEEQREAAADKKKIDELLSKMTIEDWAKFKSDEFEVKVEMPGVEESLKKEEEKVNSILDGTFWKLENLGFDELTDEQTGKRGREILEQLKPFYRKDLIKPNGFRWVFINFDKELRHDLTIDEDEYRIEPNRWSSNEHGIIINCDEDNIWYRKKYERSVENHRIAYERGYAKGNLINMGSGNEGRISLCDLYEEKIEEGLNTKQLKKYAYSNDLLEQLLFLYVIKRAQMQDEIAADLLFNMYRYAIERKAEYWIKGIEKQGGIKFKQEGELGVTNVKNMALNFLRLLISGDDPEYLFEHIKNIGEKRNIETYFTRALGKKIKDLVKYAKKQIEVKTQEYKKLQEIEEQALYLVNSILDRLLKDAVEKIVSQINRAKEIINNDDSRKALTYRTFLLDMNLTDRQKELSQIYFGVEDNLRSVGIRKGYPCLDEPKFEEFTDQEKEEFFKLVKNAESKERTAKHNRWYSYRELINADLFTEVEKQIYEITTKFEDNQNNVLAPMYSVRKLELAALADPYSWLNFTNWFNDKKFNATKNNNFTNWLLKSSKGKPSAIEQMLLGWIRSETFVSKKKFKAEFLEDNYSKKNKEYLVENFKNDLEFDEFSDDEYSKGMNSNGSDLDLIENDNSKYDDADILNFIDRFLKTKTKSDRKKERNINLLIKWIEKKARQEVIDYEELGKEFGLKRRQTIKICKEFEEFGKKHLKNN